MSTKNLVKKFKIFSRSKIIQDLIKGFRGKGNLQENPRSWQDFQEVLH